MTKFEYINGKIGSIKSDTRAGIINTSVINHLSIYRLFDQYRQKGFTVSKAMIETSKDTKMCCSLILKIKKEMEMEGYNYIDLA